MAKKNIVPAVILGSAVGDALGMPFEQRFCNVHPGLATWNGDMTPGQSHLKLPAGNWTDDTEMSVALASSLTKEYGFKVEKVAASYLEWYQNKPTGIGGTVRKAMETLNKYTFDSKPWEISGVETKDPEAVGAGTVMRAAPLGVFYSQKPDALRWACRQDAYITHANPEAYAASLAVASFIAGIIRHADKSSDEQRFWAVEFMKTQMIPVASTSITYRAFNRSLALNGVNNNDVLQVADEVAGRWGSAWQIAVTAIHCALANWDSFEKGVIAAVKLGGDADTRGAVTGAILGARHGSRKIPLAWVETLVNVNKGGEWAFPSKCASLLSRMDIDLWQAANT